MDNPQNIANRIRLVAKSRKISLKTMLSDCGLGINTVSELSKGKQISYMNLAKIAEALGTTTDYLLSGNEIYRYPGSYEAFQKFVNDPKISEQVREVQQEYAIRKLLEFFGALNEEGQGKLLGYADDLVTSGKYKKNMDTGLF